MCTAGARRDRFEPVAARRDDADRDVDVRRAERRFPVGGGARSDVADLGRARSHALAELGDEAVERHLRHAQALQPVVGERDGRPGIASLVRVAARVHYRVQAAHELASGGAVVYPQEEVAADVRGRALVERAALDVLELEPHVRRCEH